MDFTPVGAALMGNEARLAYDKGNRGTAAAGVALAGLPLPMAAKRGLSGGKKLAMDEASRMAGILPSIVGSVHDDPLGAVSIFRSGNEARRRRGLGDRPRPL